MTRRLDAVASVAEHGVAGLGEMDPNLVAPAGLERHPNESRVGKPPFDAVMGDGPLAVAALADGVPLQAATGP
jgi:hypothetical protein